MYFYDNDGDGVGNSNFSICVCEATQMACIGQYDEVPPNYVPFPGDCDDNDPTIGLTMTWYPDNDGDGFGDNNSIGVITCTRPPNHVTFQGDCDDNDPNIRNEVYTFYRDADQDSLGDPSDRLTVACNPNPPSGYVANADDLCPEVPGGFSGCPEEPFNWTTTKTYDISGAVVSSSKQFFNDLGKLMQSQSLDVLTNDTWVSSTLYDKQGRAALQTLSAPVPSINGEFEYQADFIRNSTGNTYTITDFDTNADNPAKVGNQTNSLGWYYDTTNNREPYQDITDYPFMRSVFSTLNPGSVLKTIGGNKQSLNSAPEAWLTGFSYTVPAAQEMYYVYGKDNFGTEDYIENSEQDHSRFTKSVSIDVHGNEAVVFTDDEGKILASARSGGSTKYGVVSTIGVQGYVDVHIPQGIVNSDISFIGSSGNYRIYDLRTEEVISASAMTGGHFYRVEYTGTDVLEDNKVSITADGTILTESNAKGLRYKVNYYDYAVNYYDEAGRLLKTTQPLGFAESAYDLSTGAPDHGLASSFKYNALGQLTETSSPDEGSASFIYREDGQIRFSQNTEQAINNEFSYTNYDLQGRPIESGVYQGPLSFSNQVAKGVSLKDVIKIREEGNRIVRSANTSWDAGLATAKMITGSGYIQWQFSNTNQRTMIGLSPSNANANFNTIRYAIYARDGLIKVYESGVDKGSFGSYTVDDVFKVERNRNSVVYKKNDVTFYTSSGSSSGNLLGDMAFNTPNGEIKNLVLFGPQIAAPDLGEYFNVQRVSISGSSITKNQGSNSSWYDSGVHTTKMIAGDGAVEWKVNQTNKYLMMGLSSHTSATSPSFGYIDYALYFTTSGIAYVYESGRNTKNVGMYSVNDTFKIERNGNQIKYYRNGVELYTSLLPSSGDLLYGKLSIKNLNGGVNSINMINGDYHYRDFKHIAVNANTLKKVPDYGWNGGFASEETIAGDGFVEFKAANYKSHLMLGLSSSNPNANYNTIDYAIYLNRNRYVYIYESGSSKASLGTYAIGDRFRVERTGPSGIVKYYQNGQLIHTSGTNTTAPLMIDASFHEPLSAVEDLQLYDMVSNASNIVSAETNLSAQYCKERTITDYDSSNTSELPALLNDEGININNTNYARQNFVAGNVARTYTESPETSKTWYSYDAYGRVEWMIQYVVGLGTKTIDYEYNHINGLVERVVFQKHKPSEYYVHVYKYNRIGQLTSVSSGTDSKIVTPQAGYTYYESGALKRRILYRPNQGTDYVYNLAGQLKAINHPSLTASKDPGGDANDVFGMQIDYHDDDYERSSGTNVVSSQQGQDRFDGNIKGIRWATKTVDANPNSSHSAFLYQYNKNNWLAAADFGSAVNSGNITLNAQGNYAVNNLSYDANGNLLSLTRNKDNSTGSNLMDDFSYHYTSGTNRLSHIDDAVSASLTDDLDDQAAGNYEYNSIGQLVKNQQDNIEYIYNAAGLVTAIKKNDNAYLNLYYNDRGQRVRKEVSFDNGGTWYETYYVRDASGSVMAIYESSYGNLNSNAVATEYPIYGASRLGVFYRPAGTTSYQLTDHLGNVRAVINQSSSLTNYSDYYPGGMAMPNRNIVGDYRYGYQGEFAETDDETGMPAFEARLYDPRINRWLTIDPAREFFSPYLAMGNNWANVVDPDGRCTKCDQDAAAGSTHTENGYTWTMGDDGVWWSDSYFNDYGTTVTHYTPDYYRRQFNAISNTIGGLSTLFTASELIITPTGVSNFLDTATGSVVFTGVNGRIILDGSESVSQIRNQMTNLGGTNSRLTTVSKVSNIVGKGFVYGSILLDAGLTYDKITNPNVSSFEKGEAGYMFGMRSGFGLVSLKVPLLGVVVGSGQIYWEYGWGKQHALHTGNAIQNIRENGLSIGRKRNGQPDIIRPLFPGSCFVKGTKVLMANGNQKNIENIEEGDEIMSVNIETMRIEKDIVTRIPDYTKKYRLIKAKLRNGIIIEFSPAHPFWVKGKGWSVYDLNEAETELEFNAKKLNVRDVVYLYNEGVLEEVEIIKLEDTKKFVDMYNVEFVKKNHTFFANGILVHNKRID